MNPEGGATSPESSEAPSPIRVAILAWYGREHRDFPWRRTRDPYAVLVSEVMLQQTQARRVAERFPSFLRRFPDAATLAAANDAAILAEWSGLGYNRRALALKRAAAVIAERGWPRTIAELEHLPGVGPYTARAVASLAFGVPVGVVDTNVRRWLIRRFGLDPAGPSGDAAALQRLADGLASVAPDAAPDEVASWTHASMEMGEAVCRARRPRCGDCPIADGCPSREQPAQISVPRQAPFPGSLRAYRGAVLRALVRASGHALGRRRLAIEVAADRHMGGGARRDLTERAIAHLRIEGLIHVVGSRVILGAEEPRDTATTIPA